MTPELAAALTLQLDKIEGWNGTLSEAAALDLKFHRTIWAGAGNDYLVKVLDSLTTVLFAHKTLEHVSLELRKWRLNHHRALLDVVLSPRELDIQEAVVMHLRMAYPEPERFSSLAMQASNPPPPSKRRRPATVKFRKPVAPSVQRKTAARGKR
jgi:DNA-binding GntR family transcriptional regulator